jgi:hypothetical protein
MTFTFETTDFNDEDFQQYLSDNGIWSLRGDLSQNGYYEYLFKADRDTLMYFLDSWYDMTMGEAVELGCIS